MNRQAESLYHQFKEYIKTWDYHKHPFLEKYEQFANSGYKDLLKNPNEQHEKIFIKYIASLLTTLGNIELSNKK